MKFKIATLAAIGARQDTRHLAPKKPMRRLISIAAGVAMAWALLVCHGAWRAEAMGLHHAGTAPHHRDGTPGHVRTDRSTDWMDGLRKRQWPAESIGGALQWK
jgi:hypothetical protein